mmetsp:Transcript_12238/g.35144  ORF Transcript_12238/g.35144 Transcript_12238/m.35144 type:complete len:203 (-) Transcript_12238:1091-1699(-)
MHHVYHPLALHGVQELLDRQLPVMVHIHPLQRAQQLRLLIVEFVLVLPKYLSLVRLVQLHRAFDKHAGQNVHHREGEEGDVKGKCHLAHPTERTHHVVDHLPLDPIRRAHGKGEHCRLHTAEVCRSAEPASSVLTFSQLHLDLQRHLLDEKESEHIEHHNYQCDNHAECRHGADNGRQHHPELLQETHCSEEPQDLCRLEDS